MQRGNMLIGVLVIGTILWGVSALFGAKIGDKDEGNIYTPAPDYDSYDSGYSTQSDYDEPFYGDDEEYPVGFSGTDYMEACNGNTGNCYDLEIDSDGENVERINFPNGGWRDVDSSDCDNGYCTVEDEDGTEWELQY